MVPEEGVVSAAGIAGRGHGAAADAEPGEGAPPPRAPL